MGRYNEESYIGPTSIVDGKSDERVNQFLKIVRRNLLKYFFMKKQFCRAILSGNFRMLDSLKKEDL